MTATAVLLGTTIGSSQAVAAGWRLTGSMSEVRWGHTATDLMDGRVLVVGSNGGSDTSELYDPQTGAVQDVPVRAPDGTAWVAGEFEGTVTFWAGEQGETTRTAVGQDLYLLRVSPAGALLGLTTATNACRVTAWALAALADGSALVTGSFANDITIGSTTLNSGGPAGMFLARYRADGSPVWAAGASGPCNSTQNCCLPPDDLCLNYTTGHRVAALPGGGSRVSGNLRGTSTFAAQRVPPAGEGMASGFVAAYSAAGTLEWVRAHMAPLYDVAVLADGSTFVAGNFPGPTSGPTDGQLARFSADGMPMWTRRVGTGDVLKYSARSILPFADGSAIVGGNFHNPEVLGVHTPYIARYDANGGLAWTRIIPARRTPGSPGAEGSTVERLVAFPSGGFALIGTYIRSADTTGEGTCGRMVTGDGAMLLARYDAAASIMWSKIEGGSHDLEHRPEVATFPDGTTLVGASFYGSVTLGRGEPNQTTLSAMRASEGRPHAFVARFGP